jgi:hypothetical protein
MTPAQQQSGFGGADGVGGGGARYTTPTVLRAWLYEIDQDGTSHPMGENGRQPMKTVPEGAALRISVEGGQDTVNARYLRVPSAHGMSSEPVTVSGDPRTRAWMIRNSGRTNTLRVQPYGLPATPLRPGAAISMFGEDIAVWIPVARHAGPADRGESFRLLMLSAPEPPRQPRTDGGTTFITAPRRPLTGAMQEALIAYFGEHLSWPPLPAPHVRQQKEVEELMLVHGLDKPQNWARNRHDVLAGRDGLFTAADWYPRLGGPDRAIANHLAAFHRLVELGTITLRRVRQWATDHSVEPYVIVDPNLGTGRL